MPHLIDFLPSYEDMTWGAFGLYVLAGFFGALVRIAWLDKPIRGFYRDSRKTGSGWRMGSYAELLTGMAVAVIIAGHPIRAGLGSIFAPWILNAIRGAISSKLPVMLKAALQSIVTSDTPPEN